MHQAGLTVEEALLAATAGGAELCGVDAELGRIARGTSSTRSCSTATPAISPASPSRAR